MTCQKLTVGCGVRYVSHGGDGSQQPFASASRPALVTEIGPGDVVGLMVVNPTGLFFHPLASGGVPHDASGRPGTWHWPETGDRAPVFAVTPGDGSGEGTV